MKSSVFVLMCGILALFACVSGPEAEADFMKKAKEMAAAVADRPLDEKTIMAGLKEALNVGTQKAVQKVSVADGYFKNPKIKIPLPRNLQKWADRLRKIGLGKKVDELELSMNRAAEQAAPKAKDIFVDAVKKMTITDAKNILYGKNTNEATLYFEKHTRPSLFTLFFPVMKTALDNVGATKAYKYLLGQYNALPLVEKKEYDLDSYATDKALDGLFYMISLEETLIRKDPAARVTELLKKVFK
ncbi:MAG TPA: DUF4197 domain-containing protein [Spirochaetota bacterium]|nr:DUF4197 domain-containing protein [Spirochaetota bacterium]